MNRFSKFFRLPAARQRLLLRVWTSLNFTALALRLFALPRILRWFGTNSTTAVPTHSRYSKDEIVWTIRAAAALSWSPTCAVRALVAERLLRMYGYRIQFKVGVRAGDDFQAHAWVEDDEGILVGESERPFHALPDLSVSDLVTRS